MWTPPNDLEGPPPAPVLELGVPLSSLPHASELAQHCEGVTPQVSWYRIRCPKCNAIIGARDPGQLVSEWNRFCGNAQNSAERSGQDTAQSPASAPGTLATVLAHTYGDDGSGAS